MLSPGELAISLSIIHLKKWPSLYTASGSAELEVFIFLPGDTVNPQLQLLPDCSWSLMPTGQQAEKAVTAQTGLIHPDHEEDVGLLLNNGAGRTVSGSHGTPWPAS